MSKVPPEKKPEFRTKYGLRLIIFDLDGTLTDSPAGIVWTFNTILEEHGHAPAPAEAVYPLIGLHLTELFTRFLPPAAHAAIPEYIARYRTVYHEVVVPRTTLYPGVAETLAKLSQRGLLLSIATSKLAHTAKQVCQICGIAQHFRLFVGNDSVPRPKPHPDMVLHTLAQFGVTPGEALMVGDTTHDMWMGQAAGVRTAAVTYGAQSRSQLETAGPDCWIDEFAELAGIIHGPSGARGDVIAAQ